MNLRGVIIGVALALGYSAGSHAQAWTGPGLTFADGLGGRVTVGGPFSVWPALPDGAGGATARGGQVATLPGGGRPAFELSRSISAAGMKTGLRVAARLAGPVGLGLLVVDGVRWASNRWESQGEQIPTGRWWYWQGPVAAGCRALADKCSQPQAIIEATSWTCQGPDWTGCHLESLELAAGEPGDPNSSLRYDGVTAYYPADPGPGDSPVYHTTFTLRGIPAEDAPQTEPVWEPATDGQLEQAIGDALSNDPSKAGDALQAALNAGADIEAFDPGPLQGTGPASVPGPSTTSTHVGPNGTTITSIDTTYNLTYNNSVVRIAEAVTTTTTNPDGSVETTTTESEPPETGEGAPQQEIPDPCELHPDASGCAPLGTPNPPEELGAEERSFSITPEMDAAGTCPEPIALSFMGWSGQFEYGNICALATGVRPLVLIFSWLGAAIWVFAIGRGS